MNSQRRKDFFKRILAKAITSEGRICMMRRHEAYVMPPANTCQLFVVSSTVALKQKQRGKEWRKILKHFMRCHKGKDEGIKKQYRSYVQVLSILDDDDEQEPVYCEQRDTNAHKHENEMTVNVLLLLLLF